MPVKAARIVAAGYDWSGVYIGAHIGYGGGMKDWDNQGADFVARGFLGGVQVGINRQLSSFVFGLELDGAWADIKGSQTVFLGSPAINLFVTQASTSKIDGLVTIAGRAGLAADRWFVFAKAGLAVAHETHSSILTSVTGGQVPANLTVATNGGETRLAPMLGFGAEYALGGNWSIKGEYDYFHLGARSVAANSVATINGVVSRSGRIWISSRRFTSPRSASIIVLATLQRILASRQCDRRPEPTGQVVMSASRAAMAGAMSNGRMWSGLRLSRTLT